MIPKREEEIRKSPWKVEKLLLLSSYRQIPVIKLCQLPVFKVLG